MGLHPIIEVKQLWSRLGDGWVTRSVGWVLFQGRLVFKGDYIRHPVLYELSSKYGVAGSDQVPLPVRLDELREHIRREIHSLMLVFVHISIPGDPDKRVSLVGLQDKSYVSKQLTR
ncbi:hypothetical protein M0804_013537 [Polistes exclamans]|nr:hypothetical protein M0804_013537 [Polistes exclamans]